MGLFDYEFQMEKIKAHNPPLQRLDALIDWEMFRPLLEEAFALANRKSNAGRKPYDKILMFKILILQRYYNLSDDQTEFQIKDRLSFQDFLGIDLGDPVPDAKTLWHFKEVLKEKGTVRKLFDLFTQTLQQQGIVAHEGALVDASFVTVPIQRNTRTQNKQIKNNEIPQEFQDNPHKLSQKDCDARWTKKNNQSVYGYKDHICADQKTKLITRYTVTPASVHDSGELEKLIDPNKDRVLYADSAYFSQETERWLKVNKIQSKVTRRAYRNRPLTHKEIQQNYKHSKTRVRVEHIFGTLTYQMHNALHLLAIGKERIESIVGLNNLTYNLVRFEQIVRLNKIPLPR